MSFGKRQEIGNRGWTEPTKNIEAVATDSDDGSSLVTLATTLAAFAGIGALLFAIFGGSGDATRQHAVISEEAAAKLGVLAADLCESGSDKNLVDQTQASIMRVDGDVRNASYLTCLMTRKQERFCNAKQRQVMIRELQPYFQYFHQHQLRKVLLKATPQGRAVADWQKRFEKYGGGGIASFEEIPEPDSSVIVQMQELARRGYLSRNDFGWSAPDYLTKHIKDIAVEDDRC